MTSTYYAPQGGLPDQHQLLTDRAMFTEAYAVIPRGVMRDIVTSALPFWDKTRVWILSRPLSGFAETFSNYVVEVGPGGGSDKPEPDADAEAVLFVVGGEASQLYGLGTLGCAARGSSALAAAAAEPIMKVRRSMASLPLRDRHVNVTLGSSSL